MTVVHAFDSSKRRLQIFLLIGVAILADQATKITLASTIPIGTTIPMNNWFTIVHVLNPGAAFSFLADAGGWQRHFFIIFGLIVSAILARLLWTGIRSMSESFAYVFLIGGALGNVIDRIRIGAVIDYLDLHWGNLHWPAFNLADIFVVSGAILLITTSFGVAATRPESIQ